jgi:hypothetical protein
VTWVIARARPQINISDILSFVNWHVNYKIISVLRADVSVKFLILSVSVSLDRNNTQAIGYSGVSGCILRVAVKRAHSKTSGPIY